MKRVRETERFREGLHAYNALVRIFYHEVIAFARKDADESVNNAGCVKRVGETERFREGFYAYNAFVRIFYYEAIAFARKDAIAKPSITQDA